ncbi:hypothetical protein SD70_01420 [Gordoniibacillus kamchatkensis]|uniref:Uncharacterized protein n=1 Tax=Gordoniibacillus kamchatkensis TaxID=1590651 RepID=A0ABR5AMK3_9BACL|nr:hypothetical protein SD70_01420 [Paenibacillus sp. VKM B-2647]
MTGESIGVVPVYDPFDPEVNDSAQLLAACNDAVIFVERALRKDGRSVILKATWFHLVKLE